MDLQALVDAASSRDWDTDPAGSVSIAVVGLGNYARNVSIPSIEAGDYTKVGAVVSGSEETAERVATEQDAVPLTYERFAEGDATDAYDAVYVATPNRLHLDHVGRRLTTGNTSSVRSRWRRRRIALRRPSRRVTRPASRS